MTAPDAPKPPENADRAAIEQVQRRAAEQLERAELWGKGAAVTDVSRAMAERQVPQVPGPGYDRAMSAALARTDPIVARRAMSAASDSATLTQAQFREKYGASLENIARASAPAVAREQQRALQVEADDAKRPHADVDHEWTAREQARQIAAQLEAQNGGIPGLVLGAYAAAGYRPTPEQVDAIRTLNALWNAHGGALLSGEATAARERPVAQGDKDVDAAFTETTSGRYDKARWGDRRSVAPGDPRWGGSTPAATGRGARFGHVEESNGAQRPGVERDAVSATAQTNASVKTSIRPDSTEAGGYKTTLDRGVEMRTGGAVEHTGPEVGLERPFGATTPGADSITAGIYQGEWRIFLNDSKSTGPYFNDPEAHASFKGAKDATPSSWGTQARDAVDRMTAGVSPEKAAAIRQAYDRGEVYVRQLNSDMTGRTATTSDATPVIAVSLVRVPRAQLPPRGGR